MALRPVTAKWFELLIVRDELATALQRLAETGAVELQAHSDTSASALLPALRAAVDEYKRLGRRYGEYWPQPRAPAPRAREPEEIPAAALRQLRSWAAVADPLIDRLQRLAQERSALQLLDRLLSQPCGALPNLQFLAHAGPLLASRAYLLASAPGGLPVPPSVLTQTIVRGEERYVLALGPTEQIGAFDETLSAHKARQLLLPPGLPAEREAARAFTHTRLEAIAVASQGLAASSRSFIGLTS